MEEVKKLLEEIVALLQKGIFLLEKQVALFERYDAEAFEADEIKRENQNARRPLGGQGGRGSDIS